MEKKVISFTLWGTDPMYTVGALKNVGLGRKHYPEWVCRFYVDDTVPVKVIDKLKDSGCEVVQKNRVPGHLASMWRFEPMMDEKVSRFIVRDVDARLDAREKAAVDEWEASGLPVHILRDHPNHVPAMMGGMWGGIPGSIPGFKANFEKCYFHPPKPSEKASWRGAYFGYNQVFLRHHVWPHIKDKHIAHDEYIRPTGKEKPFPVKRNSPTHFVGQKYTKDDKPVYSIDRK